MSAYSAPKDLRNAVLCSSNHSLDTKPWPFVHAARHHGSRELEVDRIPGGLDVEEGGRECVHVTALVDHLLVKKARDAPVNGFLGLAAVGSIK